MSQPPFLESSANQGRPFVDGQPGIPVGLIADIQVVAPVDGELTLYKFSPQALTNAQIEIRAGALIIHKTTSATVQVMGAWRCVTARDATRGSMVRVIVSAAAAQRFSFLATPLKLSGASCHKPPARLASINGRTGDVVVRASSYLSVDDTRVPAILDAPSPEERFPCPPNPCAGQVFTINGQEPDQDGRIILASDDCMKIHPDGSSLVIADHCLPCVDCDDLIKINDQILKQSDYLHRLSGFYHDQFNRHQAQVALANQKACIRDVAICSGNLYFNARAFDRPYFNQLVMAFVNETACKLTFQIGCTMDPVDVGLQYNRVIGYVQGEFDTEEGGQEMARDWTGFDPVDAVTTHQFEVGPHRTLTISSEAHRVRVNSAAPVNGVWRVRLAISAQQPPNPLRPDLTPPISTTNVVRAFPFTVVRGEPSQVISQ